MGRWIANLYRWFRSPRRFLKFLVAFIVASVVFHWTADYDPDFGITNLSLSIEASVASAGMLLMLEAIMERLFEYLREWRASQERDARERRQMLEAVLVATEAVRELVQDHVNILRGLE